MARRFSLPVIIGIMVVEALVVAFVVAFAQQMITGRSQAWLTSLITTMTVIITFRALYSR